MMNPAGWTIAALLAIVGVYRWSRTLTGRVVLSEFHAGEQHGGGGRVST
jgi:hypothetical protein